MAATDIQELTPADITTALGQMNGKLGSSERRALKAVEPTLEPNEHVLRLAVGKRFVAGKHQLTGVGDSGILVLTDHRVLFMHQGIVRGSHESIPLDLVTGVAVNKGLLHSEIKTTGAQSNEVVKEVNKADAEAWANELRGLLTQRVRGAMATSAPATGGGVAEQLTQLAALRDQGVLTEAEFAGQKAKLLGTA